jgi:hypothetical protein
MLGIDILDIVEPFGVQEGLDDVVGRKTNCERLLQAEGPRLGRRIRRKRAATAQDPGGRRQRCAGQKITAFLSYLHQSLLLISSGPA